MPRPKNYAFEKAQRERARLARKNARKDARTPKVEGVEEPAPAGTTAPAPDPGDKGGR